MRHCSRNQPIRSLGLAASMLVLAACGGAKTPESSAGLVSGTAPTAAAQSAGDSAVARPSAVDQDTFGNRAGELINPDNSSMVFLYYDLAGIPPPIDNWVEEDRRVKFAPAIEKAAKRLEVKAELESAIAAVRGIGSLRLSMGANLSDYDPSYGEFMVRALAPSSVVEFPALGQQVSLKFTNGRTAQIWKVPAADAQLVRDKIGYSGRVSIDVGLKITGVQPAPGGGTISTEVVDYELREDRGSAMLGRVQVTQ